MSGPPTPWLYAQKLARLVGGRLRAVRSRDLEVVHRDPVTEPRGKALLSYVLDPWLLAPGVSPSHSHTHDWESLQIGRTLLELGYSVDVISWTNDRFVPEADYDLFIDTRYNMERLAPEVGGSCLKVLHADTASIDVHNAGERQRLEQLEARRGIRLQRRRWIAPSRSVDHTDCITVLGNEFTRDSYRFTGRPVYRIPISTPVTYDWPAARDVATSRRRFLWFGSGGMVHKGLDLVLEAFAATPELELVVVGPVENEIDFVQAYRRELYATANIKLLGWVDITSARFRDLAASTLGLVYPSCSEGGGGSVLTCMHAGLVPIVTRQASVDIRPDYGILLDAATVAEIRETVRSFAARPVAELEATARGAWQHARANHTRECFSREYRQVVLRILNEFRRDDLSSRR